MFLTMVYFKKFTSLFSCSITTAHFEEHVHERIIYSMDTLPFAFFLRIFKLEFFIQALISRQIVNETVTSIYQI